MATTHSGVEAQTNPRSVEIASRTRKYEGAGMRSFQEDPPFVWDRASGARITDADGREYIDLYGAFAVAAIGHQHPRVVEAVQRQAEQLMHCSSAYPSAVRAEFYEALGSIAPKGATRMLPAITGAMANEIALTVARVRRPGAPIIAFEGGYFGRSLGTVGFAGKTVYRERVGVPAAAQFVAFPDATRDADSSATLAQIDRLIDRAGGGGKPAAILVEAIQGNGGVVVPPPDLLPTLRSLCDETGALLIVDEIQSGCGRTGRMWALDHGEVSADLMTVGKGIGGGLAVAAVYGSEDAMELLAPDAYSSTFLTNNLNLAAAVAAIGVLRDERLPERAQSLGKEVLAPRLQPIAALDGVDPLRVIGLWAGIPLRLSDGTPDSDRAARVVRAARAAGVVVGRGGYHDHVIKLSPPLVIDEADLITGLDRLGEVVSNN